LSTALERSLCYRGFSEAFRSAEGGVDLLDDALVPPPPDNAAQAFVEAFDPAISDAGCSLHASAHLPRNQADLFEELVRWYDHFGLKRVETAELPDHLSVELEFMQFLCFLEHGHGADDAARHSVRKAQREFIERHLMPLARAIESGCATDVARYASLVRRLPEYLEGDLAELEDD